jgi:hypothetical protein
MTSMKLGVGYNLWDCEELLWRSVESIRAQAHFVVIVYQRVSNFGMPCSPHLRALLAAMQKRGLVDRVIHLDVPSAWPEAKRRELTAVDAKSSECGGDLMQVQPQFFTETYKRELGRAAAEKAGCTHFMSMDADEFYLADQLAAAKQFVVARRLAATACRMRLYFKLPTCELRPLDDVSAVPFIVELGANRHFRLAVPSDLMLDPTRKVSNTGPIELLPRELVEMHHMTFVRRDVRAKLTNVSNRSNYRADVDAFVAQFERWQPGDAVIHPHPVIGRLFTSTAPIPNHFGVDLFEVCAACSTPVDLQRCAGCRWTRYCCVEHQTDHWPAHREQCLQWQHHQQQQQ